MLKLNCHSSYTTGAVLRGLYDITPACSAAFQRTSSNMDAPPIGDSPVLVTQGRCDEDADEEAYDTSKVDSSSDEEYDLVSSNYSCSVADDGEDDCDTDLDFDTEGTSMSLWHSSFL